MDKSLITKINKQLIILFCSLLFVYLMINHIPIYNWVYEDPIKANLKTIEEYKELTEQQKLIARLGADASYLSFIKANTPEDAIILMPPDSILVPSEGRRRFDNIFHKGWATYFVYPRKLIYEREKNTNPLYSKITYVAIMYYWGYDKLEYKPSKQQEFTVLPVKKSLKDEDLRNSHSLRSRVDNTSDYQHET